MKQLLTTFLLLCLCHIVLAQIPQNFSYQAVARDSSGACLSDQLISLQLSIVDDSVATNPIYQELFTNVQTNSVGHFQVVIGTGSIQGSSPEFDQLDWNMNRQLRHLKVELSPNNDFNLQEVGMTQLLAVPYATASANGKLINDNSGEEFILLYGENGEFNVAIGGIDDANGTRNSGVVRLMDNAGDIRTELGVATSNGGFINWRGPNGNLNGALGGSASSPDHGGISVRDANGNSQIGLTIDANGNGVVAADLKPFFMDHPTKANHEIWYCAIEGPEAAAYERGTTQLINGVAHVRFSDHFEIVANPTTLTVMLTPWSEQSKGLAVVERSSTGFTVKELGGGKGNYQIDWEAKAVRKNHENWQVIREKEKDPFADLNLNRQ